MALPVTISGTITISSTSGSNVAFGDTTNHQKMSQAFTGLSGVTSITIAVAKSGSPSDNINVEIRSGSETGSLLGTSDNVAGSGLSTSETVTTFTFSTPVTGLDQATTYYAVLQRTGSLNDTNLYRIYYNNAGSYATVLRAFNGSSFADQAANADARMSVIQSGISTAVACVGPFISSGGNVYFVGRNSSDSTKIQAQKATDPTSSFSAVGTDQQEGSGSGFQVLSAYQVGDTIHVVAAHGNATATSVSYYAFSMGSDSWTVTGEAIIAGVNASTSGGASAFGASCIVRSGGEVIAFFNGARVANMGNSYAQTYYSRRTGTNTWTAATQVSAGGVNDYGTPEAVLGASDAVHFFHSRQLSTAEYTQRTLNSSNSLQTVSGTVANTSFALGLQGISYDSSGTQKIVCAVNPADSATVGRFDSANTPTISSVTLEANARPTRVFVDTGDSNKVWAIYRDNADSDLYVENSTDNGATWGNKTSAFVAAVGQTETNLSIDGKIFTRGSSVVIPYVVNDNGTLKYNEYLLRTVTPVSSAKPSIELALAATAKLTMVATAKPSIVFDLAANAEIKPIRATMLEDIVFNLAANARRYTNATMLEDIVFNIAANARRFTNATMLEDVTLNLLASAQRYTTASVLEDIVFNLAADATVSSPVGGGAQQITASLAIVFDVTANAVRYTPTTAVLSVVTDLIANAARFSPTTALLSVVTDMIANAARFTPTTALLSIVTDMAANAVRFSPISAVLPIQIDLVANAKMTMAASAAPSIVFNLSAQTIQAMAARSVMAVVFDMAANAQRFTPTTARLSIQIDLIANAARFTPTTAVLAAVTNLIANAVRFSPMNAVLAIQTDLIANAKQTMAANAVLPIQMGLIANAKMNMSANATLPIVFNLSAQMTQAMAARTSLAIVFDLAANATLVSISNQLTAVLPIELNVVANAIRFTPTTAVLPIVTDLIANALRFTPTTARLPIQTDLIAVAQRFSPVNMLEDIVFNLAANTRHLMAAFAAPSIVFNLSASPRQRMVAQAVLPIELSMIAAPVQRMRAQSVLPIVFSLSADAIIAGQVNAWSGNALLAIEFSMLAQARLIELARATLPIQTDLIAQGVVARRAIAELPIVTNLIASTRLMAAGNALLPVELSLRATPNARLAAYAGLMAELSMRADANMQMQMASVLPAEFNVSAFAGLQSYFAATLGIVFNLFADPVLNPPIILPPRRPTSGRAYSANMADAGRSNVGESGRSNVADTGRSGTTSDRRTNISDSVRTRTDQG